MPRKPAEAHDRRAVSNAELWEKATDKRHKRDHTAYINSYVKFLKQCVNRLFFCLLTENNQFNSSCFWPELEI